MKRSVLVLLVLVCMAAAAHAESLRVAAGAGYKNVVEAWNKVYETKTGTAAERIYGNMGQVAAQVKLGDGICIVVGDENFLAKSGIHYDSYHLVGVGRPVIATRKGLVLTDPKELATDTYKTISIPDTAKAIYGIAGKEFLESSGLMAAVEKKFLPSDTVPRSGSYVALGEADAGFMNLTFALANKDKFGSYIVLDSGFTPIRISAAVIPECAERADVKEFIGLLSSPKMDEIRVKFGM